MADVPNTPAPAAPAAKELATAPADNAFKDFKSTSSPSSGGEKSQSPVSKAVDEVMKTLPGAQAEPEAEVEDDGSDLSEEDLKKADKQVAKLKKKLKVGGKEIEVDEDELVKRAQMGYSAEEKWQEAAKMKKQLEGFINLLQQDPASALEKMGFNVDELAEKRIQQRIEEMRKSPEQIKQEQVERELAQLKAEREQERDEAQKREMVRLQEHFAVEIENDISSALDNNTLGLPKSPYVVKRIADTMILAMKHGYKDVKAKDVLPIVQEEIRKELSDMYQASPDEVFEQLVGKDRLTKYRRGKIKKPAAKTASASDVKPTGAKEIRQTTDDRTPKEKTKARDFFKTLGTK